MKAEVKGTTMPVLEVTLDNGESVISTHGELSWMTPNMQMSQTTSTGGSGKGLMSSLKRVVGGGGLFLTKYQATGGPAMVAFAAKLPGRIFNVEIAPGKGYLVRNRPPPPTTRFREDMRPLPLPPVEVVWLICIFGVIQESSPWVEMTDSPLSRVTSNTGIVVPLTSAFIFPP